MREVVEAAIRRKFPNVEQIEWPEDHWAYFRVGEDNFNWRDEFKGRSMVFQIDSDDPKKNMTSVLVE